MSNRYLFANVDTGTVDPVDESAYVVDVDALDECQRDALDACEAYGSFDPAARALVEAVAIPLESAVEIVEGLRRVVFPTVSRRSAGWVGTGTLRVAVSMLDAELDGSLDEVRRLAVADLRRALLTLDSLSRLEGVRS